MNLYSEQSTGRYRNVLHVSKWLVRLALALAFVGMLWSIPVFQSAAYAQGSHHIVQSGETLSSIARRYGVSVSALASYNGIANANLLRVGQRLRIPVSGGGGSSSTYATPIPSYTNQPNATYGSSNGTSSGNDYGYGLGNNSTTYGGTTYGDSGSTSGTYSSSGYGLPPGSDPAAREKNIDISGENNGYGMNDGPSRVVPTPTPTWMPRVQVYTVRPGDSLSNIAAKFGSSVYALKSRNGLRSDTIYAGQRLIIP